MGLFTAIHDTYVAADILKANREINDYYQKVYNIVGNTRNYAEIQYSDKNLVLQYLYQVENKTMYMRQRLNDIAPENRFKTWVYCIDGHRTAAPGYIMAMLEWVCLMRQDLNNC